MHNTERSERLTSVPDGPEIPPADSPASAAGVWGRIMRLAAASGNPKRTAAAFALGVFLSFSPFFGLQIAIGMSVALLLRLSKAATFIGLWANLPWFMIPWYTATTIGGAFLLRVPLSPDLAGELRAVMEYPLYRAVFWERLAEVAGPFLWAFLVGSTVGAAGVGVVAYFSLVRVLHARRVSR
ncbi:MAG: DUF2062 domain-containing protein [Acidobacteria bacterium]|nr:DUF2062 domain-containing protein [Acidobacteriota bacterium]MBA3888745.1 DUF2062 domain-containing protein [Acidobacteriota bacterium]